ncbi:ChaN family lipoprotein [Arhodomonas sp. SL1]|uniref:ChaN family lipoprotein n=1 Tax=Arhodomonas sp. SL1 TaxID=3425691 RepID=UPI003F880E85
MRHVFRAALALAGLWLGGGALAATGVGHPLTDRIRDVAAGAWLEEATLTERLAAADVVLLGEEHDNPRHHALQARVIDALAERGQRPAVVLEMLRADQQDAVDRARRQHPDDVDAVANAVDWADSGWPAWAEYRPVFAAAYRHGLPLVAGNLSRGQLQALREGGVEALSADARQRLGLNRARGAGETETMARAIREGHCDLLPESMLPRMRAIQRARDGSLARTALEAADHGMSVVITGKGHARSDFAVPRVLAAMAPGRGVVTLAFEPVASNAQAVTDYAARYSAGFPFDYVWFTTAVEREDPCAELRERFGESHD